MIAEVLIWANHPPTIVININKGSLKKVKRELVSSEKEIFETMLSIIKKSHVVIAVDLVIIAAGTKIRQVLNLRNALFVMERVRFMKNIVMVKMIDKHTT